MPGTGRVRALVAVAILLALVTTSCGRFARRGAPPPTTPPPTEYGADLRFTPPATGGTGKGRLTIFVLEEGTNRPIEGVRVRYRGPERGAVVSSRNGRASVRVDPGAYHVELPPCGRDVLVTTYREATVGVVAGGEAGGQLHTTWEQRYRPSPSVQVSTPPPWDQGERVTLGVRVEDRCDFSTASRTSLRFYGWRISNHFAVAQQPGLTSDASGFLRVTVTCRRSGNGEIVVYNLLDPDDSVDLLLATSAPPDNEPFCR